jgi:hypothetical protein
MAPEDNLGRGTIWQVRDFPENLRKAIVRRAADEEMTVAQLLTQILTHAGPSTTSDNTSTNAPDPARLRSAVEMIGILHAAGVPIPARTAAVARILVGQELKALRGPVRRIEQQKENAA